MLYNHMLLSMYPKVLATQCLFNLTCPETMPQPHVEHPQPRDCSHSSIRNLNVAVAAVPWLSVFNIWLWQRFWARQIKQTLCGECFGQHRKQHVRIKQILNDGTQTEHLVLGMFDKHVHFRYAPDRSHSNVLKLKVAVAAVPWVSVLKMCLWFLFWACQIRQRRVE